MCEIEAWFIITVAVAGDRERIMDNSCRTVVSKKYTLFGTVGSLCLVFSIDLCDKKWNQCVCV